MIERLASIASGNNSGWSLCQRAYKMSFLPELKRRNLFRVGTAYVVTGWWLCPLPIKKRTK